MEETFDDCPSPGAVRPVAAASGVALVVIGASLFNILPLLTAGAADKLGFSATQAGMMSSVLTVASGLSALLAGFWVRSLSWPRAGAMALGGMCLGLLISLRARDYWEFVSMQASAGFFASAAFSLGMTVISDRQEAASGFGIAIAAQGAYQIAVLWAGPALLRFSGVNGLLALLAVPAGIAIFLMPALPKRGRALGRRAWTDLMQAPTLLAFTGCTIFFVGAGCYWTYIELIGQAEGIASQVIADCVALSVGAGTLSGLLAALQRNRFGNLGPLTLSGLLMLVAASLLGKAHGVIAFGTAGILYYFAWSYSLVYQLELVNTVDASGRAVALTGACGFLGTAGGVALAAPLVNPDDYRAVIWIAIIAALLSIALYWLASVVTVRRGRRGEAGVCDVR